MALQGHSKRWVSNRKLIARITFIAPAGKMAWANQHKEAEMNTNSEFSFVVTFQEAKGGGSMTIVNSRISFPERSGKQPNPGETWEVELAGENPKKTVYFLKLHHKIELTEWSWNNKIGSRERKPACLIVAANGKVYRFTGSEIANVVKVVNTDYVKNGKWSNTTFHCISPQGTKIYSWMQSFEEGLYWPQGSWEEVFGTVQAVAPQVDMMSLEAAIRENWGKAAEKFDENRKTIQAFAQLSVATVDEASDEVEPLEWTFNDGRLSRGYSRVCYVVTPNGKIHKFKGESIPGVCKVLRHEDQQNGKWSNTTYFCVSPAGCTIVTWSQEWDSGLYWPQTSWEEAIAWFQSQAPLATAEEIEALVRRYKEPAAQKFDENRAATASFAQADGLPQVIHLIEEGHSISSTLNELGISAPTEFEAGTLAPGISGMQADTLVAGDKAMVIFTIGPDGGRRYGYEEREASGLTILKSATNHKDTAKQVVAIIESPDWYSAWVNYHDGQITSYVLANAGGIHSFNPEWGGIQASAWEGIPAKSPSEEEMQERFGLESNTQSQTVEVVTDDNSAMTEALRNAGLI
jgi:hypothetical protein